MRAAGTLRGNARRALPDAAALAAALLLLASSCSASPDADAPGSADLASVYARLAALEASSPGLAAIRDIGHGGSAEDPSGDPYLPIRAIRIRGGSWAEGDPVVQVIGSIHGDEPLGAELCLALAGLALGSGGEDAPASLSAVALDILPVSNPWGYAAGSRHIYGGGSAAVDPNRSFPMDYGPGRSGADPSYPEILALAADAESERYAMSISLHTGAYRICVPWDYIGTTASGSADPLLASYTLGTYLDSYSPAHPWFLSRGAAYAALVESDSGAAPGSFPLVQGYDWYWAGGTYGDWLYLRLGVAPFTIELSSLQGGASISEAEIAKARSEQLGALVALAASARLGAAGRVVDAAGAAIEGARIEARTRSGARALWLEPEAYLPFGCSGAAGSFRIALPPGRWELSASKPGYEAAASSIEIGDSGIREGIAIELR